MSSIRVAAANPLLDFADPLLDFAELEIEAAAHMLVQGGPVDAWPADQAWARAVLLAAHQAPRPDANIP